MNKLHHLLRYLAVALAIYIVLKLIVVMSAALKDHVETLDLIIITVILISIFMLFDHVFSYGEHFNMRDITDNIDAQKALAQAKAIANSNPVVEANAPQIQQMMDQINKMKQQVQQMSSESYPLPDKSAIQDRYTKDPQTESAGSRADGVIDSHVRYDTNYMPVDQFEGIDMNYYPGWQVIPPEMWGPLSRRPPVCIESPKVCPPCSTMTQSDPGAMNLLEWTDNLRATGPDNINTTFVKEVLNSGR